MTRRAAFYAHRGYPCSTAVTAICSYSAFSAARYPQSIVEIGGLTPPSFAGTRPRPGSARVARARGDSL